MKDKLLIMAALAMSSLLSVCSAGSAAAETAGNAEQSELTTAQFQQISAEDAHERMLSEESVVILDVRTAEEYETGHIPGAILLPNETIGTTRPEQLPVWDTEILIYCRSGNRSAQAAEKLSMLGYTKLYDFGGINDWPYETETGAWQEKEKSGSLDSFTAYDLNGVSYDEGVFSGKKLTMLNIWATFCGPCLREMPELGVLAADYQDRDVQIIGLLADVFPGEDGSFLQENVEEAREIVAETGADYLQLLPNKQLLSGSLASVISVPTTIFLDGEGKQVGEAYMGARSGADWATIIDALLGEAEK